MSSWGKAFRNSVHYHICHRNRDVHARLDSNQLPLPVECQARSFPAENEMCSERLEGVISFPFPVEMSREHAPLERHQLPLPVESQARYDVISCRKRNVL